MCHRANRKVTYHDGMQILAASFLFPDIFLAGETSEYLNNEASHGVLNVIHANREFDKQTLPMLDYRQGMCISCKSESCMCIYIFDLNHVQIITAYYIC